MADAAVSRASPAVTLATQRWLSITVYALLFAAFIAPVLWFRFPELLDYPNHLGRMYALTHLASDPLLARYYEIRWHLVPNLAMDLLVPPLAKVIGVFLASKLFVALTMLLLATGPIAISLALYADWGIWSFTSFIFLFNGVYVMGFTNYLFGVGLALWATAAWIALRHAGVFVRFATALLFALALFVSHLYALGIYAVAIFSYEAWRGFARRARGEAMLSRRDIVIAIVPFVICGALLLATKTGGDAGLTGWKLTGKTTGIVLAVKVFSRPVALATVVMLGGLLGWGLKTRQLRPHPAAFVIAIASALLFVAMPFQLLGSGFADSRLPIAIIFIGLGMIRWEFRRRRDALIFVSVLGVLIALRLADAIIGLNVFARVYADFEHSLDDIRPGSRVLAAETDKPASGKQPWNDILLTHMPVLAMAERSSLASLAFTDPSAQVLVTRSAMRPYVATVGWPPQLSYLLTRTIDPDATDPPANNPGYYLSWPQHYDYVYVLFASAATQIADPALSLLYQGHDFQLYAVKRPAEAAGR